MRGEVGRKPGGRWPVCVLETESEASGLETPTSADRHTHGDRDPIWDTQTCLPFLSWFRGFLPSLQMGLLGFHLGRTWSLAGGGEGRLDLHAVQRR